MTEFPEIRKIAAYVPISHEQLVDARQVAEAFAAAMNRTREETAQLRAAHAAEHAARLSAARQRHARVATQLHGRLLEVFNLHKPHEGALWPECQGCDPGTGAEELPEWPCTTWIVIARDE